MVILVLFEVIGLPLTSVDSAAEGVSSSELSSTGSLPSPLLSLPASSAAAVKTGPIDLEDDDWRRSLECSERPLLPASSPELVQMK